MTSHSDWDGDGEVRFEPVSKWSRLTGKLDGLVTSAVVVLASIVILAVAFAVAAMVLLALGRLSGLVGPHLCQIGC